MSESIIKTVNLSYAYSDEDGDEIYPAITDINLELEKGSFTAILGHNGSGKSTLAKHFNAILLPTGGKCYVSGMDTSDEKLLFNIRQAAGMVFQNPDNQIIASVVDEDVAFAPENIGIPHDEIVERVESSLKAVGMYGFRSHAPHLLSGGQKQRVAIAGVLAMRPDCIILDEPTAMLDPRGRAEVMDTVLALKEKFGLTLVLITHHMEEAARADRVVILNDGGIYLDGTPREILTDVGALRAVGLDAPPTVSLLYGLNKASGSDIPLDAFDDDTCAERIRDWLERKK